MRRRIAAVALTLAVAFTSAAASGNADRQADSATRATLAEMNRAFG